MWVMEEYSDLYKIGIENGDSILYVAAKMCRAVEDTGNLSTLVDLYPSQLAYILSMTKDQGELLSQIMPFIRTSAGSQFLKFFGEWITGP